MAVTLEAFGIDKLDIDDRYELMRLIAASIPKVVMTPELAALLDARIADMTANPDDEVAWEDVLAEWAAEDEA